MPTQDKPIHNSLIHENPHWTSHWTADSEIHNFSPSEVIENKPIDNETKRRQREALSGYYRDTLIPFNPQVNIAKEKSQVGNIEGISKKGSVTDIYRVLWNRAAEEAESNKEQEVEKTTPPEESLKPISTEAATRKPRLQKPEDNDADLLKLLKDMNKLLQRIKETEEDHAELLQKDLHRADPLLFRRLLEVIKQQKASREEGTIVAQDRLLKLQEVKKTLHKIMMELKEKQAKAKDAASVTNWVGIGLTIGIAALFVASVVATILTAGAALPAAISAGSGLLGVAQGVNTGIQGYYNYKSNDHERELFGVKTHRDEHHVSIKDELHKHKESTEWATKQVSLLRQVQKSRQEASRFNK